MTKVQYLNKNERGAQYVDCDILEVKAGIYYIQFFEGAILQKIWVKKDDLRFPSFADTII